MVIKHIDVETCRQRLEDNTPPIFIDVRGTDHWTRSGVMIPGAIRIPPKEILNHLDRIPTNAELVLYCDRPRELFSTRIALKLAKLGYTNVNVLKGGFKTWLKARLPIESKSNSNMPYTSTF